MPRPSFAHAARTLGLLTCLLSLALPRAALAQVRFTTPVPTFEQSLAEAKRTGKPLVLELTATWCRPCQLLAQDLEKQQARQVLAPIHMVIYDGFAEETGIAVKEKLKAPVFPTLIAFDTNGTEIARTAGYANWRELAVWLRRIPMHALTTEQVLARAEAAPRDGQLQLDVATRLVEEKELDKARTCYARAQKAGPQEVAATAAWALLRLRHRDQTQQLGQTQTEQLAAQYPGTYEAGEALTYLATLAKPPQPLLATLLRKHLMALSGPDELEDLAYLAMKAEARPIALQVADRLAALQSPTYEQLDAQAEVAFYVEGNVDKAVALSERARAVAPLDLKEQFKKAQERYRRNKKEPSDTLRRLSAPDLAFPEERVDVLAMMPKMPPMFTARMDIDKALGRDCWQQAGSVNGPMRVMVLAASKPGEHRFVFPRDIPPAWSTCAIKTIQAMELPEGVVVESATPALPRTFEMQREKAKQAAESSCAPYARSAELMAALTGESGKPVVLMFPAAEAATAELRGCIEKAFTSLVTPRPLTQAIQFRFAAKPAHR